MLRTVLLAGAFCAAVAQLSDVERSNIDVVEPPGFQLHNMTFSLMMNCVDTTGVCFAGTQAHPGLFNKGLFIAHLVTAYNIVSKRVRASYPDGSTVNVDTDAFELTADHVSIERLMTQTSPYSPDIVIRSLDDIQVETTDPSYWNVFLRMTLSEVPVDVSEQFRSVIFELSNLYGADALFHYDSIWISSEAFFITDQLEPVTGRGHKDQKLLIPLIMGVFCMLVVPVIISACFVVSAKRENKNLALLAQKEKQMKEITDDLVVKQGALNVYHDTEETREEEQARHLEEQKHRDETELSQKDVDWLHGGTTQRTRAIPAAVTSAPDHEASVKSVPVHEASVKSVHDATAKSEQGAPAHEASVKSAAAEEPVAEHDASATTPFFATTETNPAVPYGSEDGARGEEDPAVPFGEKDDA